MQTLITCLAKTWDWLTQNILLVAVLALALSVVLMQFNANHNAKLIASANKEAGLQTAEVTKSQFFESAAVQEANLLRQELDAANARNKLLQDTLVELQNQQAHTTTQFEKVINEKANQDWRNQPVPSDVVGVLK